MIFRKAKYEDIDTIELIYKKARETMHKMGIRQWLNAYPSRLDIEKDIEEDALYVFLLEDKVYGVSYLGTKLEESYKNPIEGQWSGSEEYLTIHRLAVDQSLRGTGFSSEMMNSIFVIAKKLGIKWIRVDTHEDNLIMHRYLLKHGFTRVTKIILEDQSERNGYDIHLL